MMDDEDPPFLEPEPPKDTAQPSTHSANGTLQSIPKKKKTRNRGAEYERRKILREELATKRELEEQGSPAAADTIKVQLALLAKRTAGTPTDADRDIDFAYRNSANPTITPLMAPSLGAWQWYEYARNLPEKFLEICAKREDAKAKAAGSISAQRMEDDKRQQFAVIDRIVKQLEIDVKGIIDDLMKKFPEDVLNACRKHEKQWNDYFDKYPLTRNT